MKRLLHKMVCLFWVVIPFALGCQPESQESPKTFVPKGQALKADAPEWMEGNPVHLALVDVTGELPQGDLNSLFADGIIEALKEDQNSSLSGKVRNGLLIALDSQDLTWGDGTARRWRYKVQGEIPAMTFPGGFRFPFKLNANSEIELARVFSDEVEAGSASPLTLQNLPYNVNSALALPVGSVVTVPINGRLAMDVSGSFLTRTANFASELIPRVISSTVGTLSGIRQGTLVGQGRFQLQFIRMPENKVRVRVFAGSDLSGNVGGTFSTVGAVAYTFIPCSILDRAREIRRRVEDFGKMVLQRKSSFDRTLDLYQNLPGQLQLILDHLGPNKGPEENWIEKLAGNQEDGALSVLAQGGASLEALENTIESRVKSMIQAVAIPWKNRVQPTVNAVKKWSSRVFALNGIVNLSNTFSRKVRTLGDYTFDLNDSVAQIAFERAISGRTALIGAFKGIENSSVTDALYGDLTLAESIATEDEGNAQPRVKRETLAFGDMYERRMSARISALWMSAGTSVHAIINQFMLTDETGETREWYARAWELTKDASWWGDSSQESMASGAFLNSPSGATESGGYWMSWNKTYGKNEPAPIRKVLNETLNLTGYIGGIKGVPALYSGEFPGKVNATVDIAISKEGLDLLFDKGFTSDELLWKVFGVVARTYDISFGFPFIANPVRPEGLDQIPGAEMACEDVAMYFGGQYCHFFANDFLPGLRAVQEGTSELNRVEFLADYYERGGWMGNPTGSRVLVRFLTTFLYALYAEDEVTLKVSIQNDSDQSEAASPQLISGDPELLATLRVMTPEGFR